MTARPRASHFLTALAVSVLGACTGRDVVAKVDGTKLHQADLAAYRGARGRDPKEALGELVDRTLLAQAARKAGVDDDPTVRARVRAAEREILAQAYAERELGGATSEEKLRKRYSEEKERLVRKEIHVAHIAVQIVQRDPSSRVAAQSKASRIYSRITGGEPFEKVARDLSDDPVSKGRGGDLGPIREGQVDSRFFDAAAALKRGEVSKPFESAFGFHVVKALEDARTVTPSFEEVRGVLAAEARVAAEASLLGSLREKASVKLYPERLQTSEAKPDHSKGDAR